MSCSEDKSITEIASDQEALALLKNKDKRDYSDQQFRTIVDYLDKYPLRAIETYSKKDRPLNSNRIAKSQAAADVPSMNELMAVVVSSSPYDNWATVTSEYFGGGPNGTRLIYKWTIAENALGLFAILSIENINAVDAGINAGGYRQRYSITSLSHQGSYIQGIHGAISWSETSSNYVQGLYGAYFFTNGLLQAPGYNKPLNGQRYANITAIVSSNGYVSN